jgi:hypothetical protein
MKATADPAGEGRNTMVSAERLRLVEADQARSRAYRWGEDGLAGVSDDRQQLARGKSDPEYQLFCAYFHGDNGAGVGASHQTGWTGTAGLLPLSFRGVIAEGLRTGGRGAIKNATAGRRTGAGR